MPTLRVNSLGAWIPAAIFDGGLDRLVANLRESIGETIVIAVQNELLLDFPYTENGPKYAGQFAPIERYPRGRAAVKSPLGWQLMTEFDRHQLERVYLRSAARSLVDKSELPLAAFLSRVAEARRARFLLTLNWPVEEISVLTVALPVRPFGQRMAMGVSVDFLRIRSDLERVLRVIDSELQGLPQLPGPELRPIRRLTILDDRSGETLPVSQLAD